MESVRELVGFFLKYLLVALALGAGLRLSWAEVRPTLARPVVWRAVAVCVVAVPILTIVVVELVPMNPVARGLLVLLAISPGCPFLIKGLTKRGFSDALAATLTALLLVLSVVVLPIWIAVLSRELEVPLTIDAREVIRRVLLPILVPLALGMALRAWAPRLADRLLPLVSFFFNVGLVLALLLVLVLAGRQMPNADWRAVLATVVATFGSGLLGHLAGGRDPRDQYVTAISAMMGNPALALAVAHANYPDLKLLGPLAGYLLIRGICMVPYASLLKHRMRRRSPPPQAGAPMHRPARAVG